MAVSSIGNNPTFLNYPPTLGQEVAQGQHYMMINSYESLNAITSGSKLLSSVGLYIPAGSLKTSFKGNYTAKEGAATLATLSEGKFLEAAAQKIKKEVNSVIDKTGFLSAQGKVPNNYMALVYQGPSEFRSHSFAFKFFPKTKTESRLVRDILSVFKTGTLPRMQGGSSARGGQELRAAYFKSPRQHEIAFYQGASSSENPFLFKIGRSVITGMDIDYDPQTMVGFHSDGAPVGINLNLTFQEIELEVERIQGAATGPNLSEVILQNQSSAAVAEEISNDDPS